MVRTIVLRPCERRSESVPLGTPREGPRRRCYGRNIAGTTHARTSRSLGRTRSRIDTLIANVSPLLHRATAAVPGLAVTRSYADTSSVSATQDFLVPPITPGRGCRPLPISPSTLTLPPEGCRPFPRSRTHLARVGQCFAMMSARVTHPRSARRVKCRFAAGRSDVPAICDRSHAVTIAVALYHRSATRKPTPGEKVKKSALAAVTRNSPCDPAAVTQFRSER